MFNIFMTKDTNIYKLKVNTYSTDPHSSGIRHSVGRDFSGGPEFQPAATMWSQNVRRETASDEAGLKTHVN